MNRKSKKEKKKKERRKICSKWETFCWVSLGHTSKKVM